MKSKISGSILLALFFLVLTTGFASPVAVNAKYITVYPGEEGSVSINVKNNENFDIEKVSLALNLEDVPFTATGSSEKDLDDISEDDDDSVTFKIQPSTDITPGDYNVPYTLKYINANNNSEDFEKTGSFGVRVSAKTDLDFSVETSENPIVGQSGRVTLEVINKGLGEIKSVSVQIIPSGFELLSKDKVFIGTINADDTDLASFDVVYKTKTPVLSANIDYKDFDNNDKKTSVNLPFKVYTEEEALNLGLIKKSNTTLYIEGAAILLVAWLIWRAIKKRRKNNRRNLTG